jgi:hypothetical protein
MLFVFFALKEINLQFPRYEELQQVTGEFENCWEFSRGGKNPSLFLAVQLREKGIFSMQNMHGQYNFAAICQELQKNSGIPVKVFFEKSNYEHAWNAFLIRHKEDGFIWDLQQGNTRLVDYSRELSIQKANKKGVIIFLGFFIVLTGGISIWGIKDIMYPRKRTRKKKSLE